MNRLTIGTLLASALLCGVVALGAAPMPSGAVFTSMQPNASSLSAAVLQPPTNLTATAAAVPGEIDLGWTASGSSFTTGYRVYRATTSGGPYTLIGSTGWSTTGYPDTGLTTGQAYYYVVQAVDQSWASAYSNEATATAP